MQIDVREHSGNLSRWTREHFGDNAYDLRTIVPEGCEEQGFFFEFLVYRSFRVQISLGFSSRFKDGIIYLYVYVGGKPEMLDGLTKRKDEVCLSYNREAILNNLEILDEYLQWRMTDAQKKTFGLI